MLLAGDPTIATPMLILAGEQTSGRGRGANRWWSSAGALTFSLVFDPQKDQLARGSPALETEHWPRVALAAGVALCDEILALAPGILCGLKWPNDVLLNGRKVAGILVEVPPAPLQVPRRVVLGMGVNVNNSMDAAPADVQAGAASLIDFGGSPFDMSQLLIGWLNRFAEHLHALALGDGALPRRWQSLCVLSGLSVELQSGNRTVQGLCQGIAADGALLVDGVLGPERLYAGVLVRASSATGRWAKIAAEGS